MPDEIGDFPEPGAAGHSVAAVVAKCASQGYAETGVSLTSNHPDVTDPRQAARWMIERAAAARRAALDSLFVGDQHVSPTPYYQNTPMLGRLLAEPAGCLFLLPLWHPVLVAEQIGTLAAIAQGPFIMQCGLGWGEARFGQLWT
jgi:alkanesulfonate monooxygenase SsuD/methylene tetrahydromethanopterin reductase-like flavin-dependent oxidoreductase (luciferase family)